MVKIHGLLSYHIPWKGGAKQYAGCMNLPIHEPKERATDFKRTADSVETVFLETLSLRYLLVDGIRGYVLWNVTMKRSVKVRDRSGVCQI